MSAPIAVVLMGLIVGNRGSARPCPTRPGHRLFDFWEVVDDLLNLLLFGLIGLEMMALQLLGRAVSAAAALGIVIVLVARLSA